jgi:hypothetical protein
MPSPTHPRRYDTLQAHAAALVIQAGGVAHLDSLTVKAAQPLLVSLARQLADTESCTYQTARQHVDRACRQARHPDYRPPAWGGDRTPPTD